MSPLFKCKCIGCIAKDANYKYNHKDNNKNKNKTKTKQKQYQHHIATTAHLACAALCHTMDMDSVFKTQYVLLEK